MKDAVATIHTSGRGTLGPGTMVNRGGGEEVIADLYDMTVQGLTTFDTAMGTLLEAQYLIQGTPTASSESNQGTQGIDHVQGPGDLRAAGAVSAAARGERRGRAAKGRQPLAV